METITLDESQIEMITPKELIDSDDEEREEDEMDIPTTVTIVEEDGSTSVVDNASVSSIITDASGAHSSIQFGQAGGVTYRVVGISEDGTYQTAAASTASQVQVIQPATMANVNGQYYVINSNDILSSRSLGNRTQIIDARSIGRLGIGKTSVRDEKKRATHNEVERRRRDKINGWINKLAKIVPSCSEETKQGQVHKNTSKGGILAKACEYINDLRATNCRLAATLKEHENTAEELDNLRRENAELRRENQLLKQQIGPTEDDSTVIITTTER